MDSSTSEGTDRSMGFPKGTEVRIVGERGQFHVLGEKVERDGRIVVTVYGGSNGRVSIRSFYAERVKIRKRRHVSG